MNLLSIHIIIISLPRMLVFDTHQQFVQLLIVFGYHLRVLNSSKAWKDFRDSLEIS
jgi:hypothetical protein